MKIFGAIETYLTRIEDKMDAAAVEPYVTALEGVVIAYITLLLVIYAINVFLFKKPQPFSDLLTKVLFWLAIYIFAFNLDGMLDAVRNGIDSMYNWASNGTSLFAQLDSLYDKMYATSEKIYKADESTFVKAQGLFGQFLIMMGFLLFAIIVLFVAIFTTLSLQLLVLFAPFAIVTLYFGWLKQTFSNWVQAILANTITVLFVSLFFKFFSDLYSEYTAKALAESSKVSEQGLVSLAFEIMIFSLVMALFAGVATYYGFRLAGASIDTDTWGGMRSGTSKGISGVSRGYRGMKNSFKK
jgi:type IV secretion system protein VirB6